jgi:hypothetical protein
MHTTDRKIDYREILQNLLDSNPKKVNFSCVQTRNTVKGLLYLKEV